MIGNAGYIANVIQFGLDQLYDATAEDHSFTSRFGPIQQLIVFSLLCHYHSRYDNFANIAVLGGASNADYLLVCCIL